MSAFIVSRETMHRCVAAIEQSSERPLSGPLGHLPDAKAMSALGRRLFEMNAAAFAARYRESPIEHVGPAPTDYCWRRRPVSPLAGFYALDCLLYQCAEGEVPQTALYQAVERVRDALARLIAHNLASKEKLPWDYPEIGGGGR